MPPNNRIKDEKTGSGVRESRPRTVATFLSCPVASSKLDQFRGGRCLDQASQTA